MGDAHNKADDFDSQFEALTGFPPMEWQKRLFREHFITGDLPSALDVPTGLGKTSVIAIWLIARALKKNVPRRLVYVVDRRTVVDQATTEAKKLRKALAGEAEHSKNAKETIAKLNRGLDFCDGRRLPISTLRGAYVDNREWLDDPSAPAIIIGTVDMIGSRLLFEGYGVSRKMRPYQAGLLGIDALVVLDESHLVPPFAHLLRAVEQDPTLRAADPEDRKLLPRFVFLPLSATQRESMAVEVGADKSPRKPFRLKESDWKGDEIAKGRLNATKRLNLKPLAVKEPDKQLAAAALELATKDNANSRVVIFCDRRDKGGDGPSAQGVAEAIISLAKGDKKAGRAEIDIELLVGARRTRERSAAEKCLGKLGFVRKKVDLQKPAFLIATSAGEVGVDIDADHMVCDLVAWERMVQRLGRVNRRGLGDAEVRAFWSTPALKDSAAPTEAERRALTAFASKKLVEKLSQHADGSRNVSPSALRRLTEDAQTHDALKKLIDDASTLEPLRPAINSALLDAWSMTSLEKHTGRPEVAPWLRGWVEETQQTTIVWRTHLPVRRGSENIAPPNKVDIEDFFEAAPLHESEKLETETYRVAGWLDDRGKALLKPERRSSGNAHGDDNAAPEDPEVSLDDDAEKDERSAHRAEKLRRDDIVAFILTSNGEYSGFLTYGQLTQERKERKAKDEFQNKLAGEIIVVDARLGGLTKDGLLDNTDNDDLLETADASADWSKEVGFRVKRCAEEPKTETTWRFENKFVLRSDGDSAPIEWLTIEHFRTSAQKEDSRAISKPQRLSEHQDWARGKMRYLAKAVDLAEGAADALVIGAALHDEGKKAPRWQRAFNAPIDIKKCSLTGPLAKTRGPINQALLGHYRHEFGSLPFLEADADFKRLPDDLQELVLHIVAAHHGQARPLIEIRGCDDGPPSALEERARAVALRFARLQKRWGPWGLAWLEALMRAADQQASRDNDADQNEEADGTKEIA